LQPDSHGTIKTLKFAIISSLLYSLGSVAAGSTLVLLPAQFWNSAHSLVTVAIVSTLIWVLYVSLAPLALLLAPAFGPLRAPSKTKSEAPAGQ
jgi:hypothetical protein